MSNSLRAKISKLRHDGNITDAEYQELIKKLDEHDKQIREKIKKELWEFPNEYSEKLHKIAYEKGRADKYQEIVSEHMLLTEEQVTEIRADAIDECIKEIDKMFVYTDSRGNDRYASYSQINRNSIHSMLENLKEQNNAL